MSYVIHDTAAGELGVMPIRFAHRIHLPDAFIEVYRVGTSYIGADNTASVMAGLDADERLYCRPGGGSMLIGLDGIPGPGRPHAMRYDLREALAITRHIGGYYSPAIPVEPLLSEKPAGPDQEVDTVAMTADTLANACANRIAGYEAVRAGGLERPWHELDSRITALRDHMGRLGHPDRIADINPPTRWAVEVRLQVLINADDARTAAELVRDRLGDPGGYIGHIEDQYAPPNSPRLAKAEVARGDRPIAHADKLLDHQPPDVDGRFTNAYRKARRDAGRKLRAHHTPHELDNVLGLAILDLFGPNADTIGPQPTADELTDFRVDPTTKPAEFAAAYRDARLTLTEELAR